MPENGIPDRKFTVGKACSGARIYSTEHLLIIRNEQ